MNETLSKSQALRLAAHAFAQIGALHGGILLHYYSSASFAETSLHHQVTPADAQLILELSPTQMGCFSEVDGIVVLSRSSAMRLA